MPGGGETVLAKTRQTATGACTCMKTLVATPLSAGLQGDESCGKSRQRSANRSGQRASPWTGQKAWLRRLVP